jgi:hypothetical protein
MTFLCVFLLIIFVLVIDLSCKVPVRLVEKPWLKVLFADLLWEKNIFRWLKKYSLISLLSMMCKPGQLLSNYSESSPGLSSEGYQYRHCCVFITSPVSIAVCLYFWYNWSSSSLLLMFLLIWCWYCTWQWCKKLRTMPFTYRIPRNIRLCFSGMWPNVLLYLQKITDLPLLFRPLCDPLCYAVT